MSNEQKKIWVEFNRNCEKNKIPKPSQNHFEILLKHSGCDVKKTKEKWFYFKVILLVDLRAIESKTRGSSGVVALISR